MLAVEVDILMAEQWFWITPCNSMTMKLSLIKRMVWNMHTIRDMHYQGKQILVQTIFQRQSSAMVERWVLLLVDPFLIRSTPAKVKHHTSSWFDTQKMVFSHPDHKWNNPEWRSQAFLKINIPTSISVNFK